MLNKNFKNSNNNKFNKFTAIYYAITIISIFILVYFLGPSLNPKKNIKETDYGTFLNYIDKNEVTKVMIGERLIKYEIKEGNKTKDLETATLYNPSLVKKLYEHNVKFEKVWPKEINPIISGLISIVTYILVFAVVWYFLIKIMSKRFGEGGVGPMSFGKSNAKIYVKSTHGITFENVAGQDEAKDALKELVDFLDHPKKYAAIGAKLPKGALLVGPPGTGKTLLAEALASEADVPFFSISGSEFVEMFVGLGAAKVRDLFKQAQEKAPCIVFIDEIETIGKKREGMGFSGNDEREQTLNQLLSEMDGFDSREGVVIIGATNIPDSLDPALLRPGRFDRIIPVELPDLAGRIAILKVHAKDIKREDNLDYGIIARATVGASGADLANIINEAALRAVREGRDKMNQSDLEESVEVVLAGYEKKNAVIPPSEKKVVAYHEVGHALVAARQNNSAPVNKITIVPRTKGSLGYTMQVEEEEKLLMNKEELFNKIVTLTGGRSAEELIFNTRTSGAANDIEKATKIAKAMISRYGMSDEFGMVAMETINNKYLGGDASLTVSPETETKIDKAVQELIEKAHNKAIGILKENLEILHEIATYLLQNETISGEEFMEFVNKYDDALKNKNADNNSDNTKDLENKDESNTEK